MLGSRFYYLHPLLAGPIAAWAAQLDRIAAMRFDTVVVAPPFAAGRSGDLFLTADPDRLDRRLGGGGAAEALARLAEQCRCRRLGLMLDLVVDRIAIEQARNGLARWYCAADEDEPPDPRRPPRDRAAAALAIEGGGSLAPLVEHWSTQLRQLSDAGVTGFRCLDPHLAPAAFWHELIATVRQAHPETAFLASASEPEDGDAGQLASGIVGSGIFDRVTCWFAGWDYRAEGFAERADRLARAAPLVAGPEAPFARRLGRTFRDGHRARLAARRAIGFGAALGAGWLMPMGFEFGAVREMDPARDRPEDLQQLIATAPFDLSAEIAEVNARHAANGAVVAALRSLSAPDAPASAMLLVERDGGNAPPASRVVVVNPSLDIPVAAPLAPLLTAAGFGSLLLDDENGGHPLGPDASLDIAPGEVCCLRAAPAPPIARRRATANAAAAAPRIAIEAVSPSVDDGRFAAKRLVGENVEVTADLISDGHDLLAAAVLWRPDDEAEWRESPMRPLGNDRWAGSFPLIRLGRHRFTVLAWKDSFGNFAEELEKKHAAGVGIELELEEGRLLVAEIAAQAAPAAGAELAALALRIGEADPEERRRLLLAPGTAALAAAARVRPFAHRHPVEYPVEAERRAAGFASWYELFPRSQSGDAHRHGTFDDVVARLPAIASMGFDVVYFPPIHPIGRTNRKGRDNAPKAEPGEPGSPYAIGGAEGGHDAIHPALGTLDDFRRLREAAASYGIELALDFAVQCSPDHPWLRQHPDWFQWRPDGSIRYAENPPKKYEDIVNVDFYAASAVPSLWRALRDVVLFWAGEGIRLFRVDNPHTKPFPFWEWLIAEVRARHPDAIFLAEAFTRPKVMYRLAKLGFSQSYTYFTWRNSKAELTEYLTELTRNAREFFRPHFFVNTPDINPAFLQTSGRPGFLIRAALAATLSGLFGVYSGFELCEARALPGREEYASSEKYEIRAWDWQAPGNIIREISQLNRIRRANPALQTHLGVSFHNAFNDRVLYYSKATEDRQNVVLVAVNLDPHFAQECDIEVPVWLWGLPDSAAVAVTDLMTGHRFTWAGKMQHIRLEPEMPFAIWRIRPLGSAA